MPQGNQLCMCVCVCVCVCMGGVICIINTSACASARKNLKDEVNQANNARSRSLGSVGIWDPLGPGSRGSNGRAA